MARNSLLACALVSACFVCILLFVTSCARDPESGLHEYGAIRMGTEVRVLLHAEDEASALAAASEVFDRIAYLDSLLSDYRSDSELARVARAAGARPVVVSDALVRVLLHALRLARDTDGAFDPTVGPVTVLWREARRNGDIPDSAATARAAQLVDWRAIELDTLHRTVRLARPGMRLDLGGIAKGFAADEALRILRDRNHARALIVFGGEIVAGDAPPGEAGWRVRSSLLPDRQFMIANRALSASGDAEQFVIANGQRYSHVIDTRTGLGLTSGTSATVLAEDGMTADALATAVTALPPDRQTAFITSHPEASFHLVRR